MVDVSVPGFTIFDGKWDNNIYVMDSPCIEVVLCSFIAFLVMISVL